MIVGVGQVIAATITPTLTTVPKGAYVNGGGDQDNDNHYWQQVKVQFDTYHPNAGIFTMYLPDGMYLADIDGDGNLSEDIVVSYDDTNALNNPFMVRYFSANGDKNELSFVYVTGDGTDLYPPRFPDTDMIAYLMFPIVTDLNPTVTNDDYRISFGVPAAKITTLQIQDGDVATAGITVGTYLKGDNGDGDFTDGDEVLFVVQAIDVSGDPDLMQVVYTGADPGAGHDVAVVTYPEQTFALAPAVVADVTGVVGTGSTDQLDVLPIEDATAGSFTVGQYASLNVANTPVAVVIATAAGTGAEDSLYVLYSGLAWAPGADPNDNIDALAAPGAYVADDADLLAAGAPAVYTGDDVAAGDGPSITYATDLQRLMGSLVGFTTHFYGNNDQTTTHGEKHPASDDVFITALPNVAFDAGDGFYEFTSTVSPTHSTNLELGFDNTDNNGEVLFYVWALPDSLQTYVWPTMTGAQPVLFYATTLQPVTYEGKTNGPSGAIGATGLATSNLPEGSWYFYVTSNVTGRHVLARSDKVIIRHWPYVRMVGWDRDAGATPAFDGITDDGDVVLDSGLYYGYDPTPGNEFITEPRKTLDLYLKVDDYDSNADIKVFYSTAANLDTTAIQTSGSPLEVTGLTGATSLTSTVYYDDFDEDTNGFIKLSWDINPTGGSHIPAGDYTIYVVANDGVHQSISASKGEVPATQDKVTVKHSPNLTLDALTEYDLAATNLDNADVVVDPSQTDVVMLSWGKSGTTGAQDIDNSATITFYIDYDDENNNTPDYLHNQASLLQQHAGTNNALPGGPHRIALNLEEDLESKDQMWYAWNLAKDFAETGWRPYDQSLANDNFYHIYAVIDEVTGDAPTKRVVILGGYTTPTTITFDNKWFARLADPPVDGVTISADETLSLRYQAFDYDNIAQVGIFLVKEGVDILGTGENAPSTIKLHNIWDNTFDGDAYCITDNNGWLAADVATGDGTFLSESTYPSYSTFSFTPRLPTQDRKLAVISIPATAGFTVGGYVTAENGATGRITDLVLNTSLTVEYTGTNFSAAGGSSGVDPSQAYSAPATTAISAVNGPCFGKYWYSMVNATDGRIGGTSVYNSLNSGTYWPYIAMDDSTYYKVTLTCDDVTPLDVGNYVYNSTDAAHRVGRIIAKAGGAGGTVTIVYPGAVGDFANGDALDEWTDPTDPTSDTTQGAAINAAVSGEVKSNNFTGWNISLHRAPGALTIMNAEENAPQRNLMISPVSPIVTVGDTISYSVRAADEGNEVDLIDVYIAVEKAHFTLVNGTTPFTDTTPSTLGNLIANRVIDDDANGRWILNATIFNSGAPINPANYDLGSELCTFKVISKGTTNAIGATTSIYYVNEPAKGWVTRFSNNDHQMFISMGGSTVKMVPRAIIEGIVEFQGRSTSDLNVDFELRKRGSYVPSTDTHFVSRNDADSNSVGMQMALDNDGKFSLFQVPTGEWDLVVKYDRYLSKLTQVSIYPGLDTLFVTYGTLLGGDCYGYVDSTGAVMPNNVIDQDDIDRISTAYLSTSATAEWNNGSDNYMWADINEDGIVYVEDLSLATGNYLTGPGTTGAQPVYQKPAVQPVASNLDAIVSLMNLPTDVKAGRTYTFQVVVQNAGDVRGYDVSVDYDTNIFSYAGIRKGDFINAQSYFFPVEGEGHIGFVNSVYGTRSFSGDGMLMEVSFTANRDGVFSSDMVALSEAVFVNSSYLKETILSNSETGLSTDAPTVFELSQNFPNPFNPTTTINFSVPQNGNVSLKIYDVLGRHVATLVDGSYSAGNYNLMWNATDVNGNLVSNGIYFYKLEAGSYRATKRMLFLK